MGIIWGKVIDIKMKGPLKRAAQFTLSGKY